MLEAAVHVIEDLSRSKPYIHCMKTCTTEHCSLRGSPWWTKVVPQPCPMLCPPMPQESPRFGLFQPPTPLIKSQAFHTPLHENRRTGRGSGEASQLALAKDDRCLLGERRLRPHLVHQLLPLRGWTAVGKESIKQLSKMDQEKCP